MCNASWKIRRAAKRISSANIKVDFVIAGTQKGGTSALDAYLREHPQICMADKKEVHFFDNERFFPGNKSNYSHYHSFFTPKKSTHIIGESTPIYMYWYDAPRRIFNYNPDMKVIVILRNPIERAYSHWNMERSRNADNFSFWEAILNERSRRREALPYQHRVYSYIDRGFYLEQLRRLFHFFSEKNVLVLRNENLRTRPIETLNSVCNFLQVRPFEYSDSRDEHSLPYVSSMELAARNYLKYIFEYEILSLERELGWDCSDWLGD